MQALYTLESAFSPLSNISVDSLPSNPELTKKGIRILNEKIDNSADLFALMLAYLSKISQYAEVDARIRSAKYLPSEADKSVSIKIAGNEFLWNLLENPTFQEKIKEAKLERYIDQEWVKKIYRQLTLSVEYQDYIQEESRLPSQEKEIIKHLWYKEILTNEGFLEFIADDWSTWEDDKEMMFMLIENFFKKPKDINFLKFISADKKEYALNLLETTIDKRDYVMELIQPKLKNWDAERVAMIDMVLLKMGVCELLYFPTIPTKVTINEYIEVAKMYSTENSGQFVNGVLDNILKDLMPEGMIRKIDRKK